MHWIAAAIAGVSVLFVPAPPLPAQNDTSTLTVKAASVGVGGRAKSGFWAPIRLDLQAGPAGARGQLEIVIPDGDNIPVIFADEKSSRIDLQPGQQLRLLRYAKIGPAAAPIRVQLRDGDRILWEQALAGLPTRLHATQQLVVGIGPAIDLPAATATIKRPAELSLVLAQIDDPGELPDRWWGYEGVDCLVLTTSDPRVPDGLTPDQQQALLDWVRLGGRLVLSIGSRGDKLLTGPWAAIAPGQFVEVSPLRERAGLESFGGAELPWEDEAFQRMRPLVTRLANVDGLVLVDETAAGGGRPLVVRGPHGLGEIVFVGLDLDHPGLAKWAGRPRLVAALIAGGQARTSESQGEVRRSVGHLGYEDLVGQLRAALDQFPGVTMVNFTTVSVLMVAYLLLIGPGDYLLLSRLGIQRHITWLTFSLVAVAMGLAAWYLGREAHGDRVRVNQVEIVDLDSRAGLVRGTVWSHLYSPTTARFQLDPSIDPRGWVCRHPQGWLAWQGLPGDSLGGLDSRQIALVEADPYRIESPGERPQIADLPVQNASSKSLSVRWWGATTLEVPSRLVRTEHGPVTGELTNPLPVALSDCLLVYGDWMYRLGTLEPGQSVPVDPRESLNLEYRLTERTVVDTKDISTQWDQASTDIPRIVRMMMFHEAARGRSYTGLTHRYQPYLDLTEHVRMGRAVLAGRAAGQFTQLGPEGDHTAHTYFRIVYPVQSPAAGREPLAKRDDP
jgi:hypothetical protein